MPKHPLRPKFKKIVFFCPFCYQTYVDEKWFIMHLREQHRSQICSKKRRKTDLNVKDLKKFIEGSD